MAPGSECVSIPKGARANSFLNAQSDTPGSQSAAPKTHAAISAVSSAGLRTAQAGAPFGSQFILGPSVSQERGTPPYTFASVLPPLVWPISKAIWLSGIPQLRRTVT